MVEARVTTCFVVSISCCPLPHHWPTYQRRSAIVVEDLPEIDEAGDKYIETDDDDQDRRHCLLCHFTALSQVRYTPVLQQYALVPYSFLLSAVPICHSLQSKMWLIDRPQRPFCLLFFSPPITVPLF
jgi:hypothetical protein